MADALTFPQHGDEPDASYFSKLVGTVAPGLIHSGLGFSNIDYTNLSFDVDAGTAYIVRATMSTASSDISPQETIEDAVMAVQYPGTTGLSLDDGAVNHVYLDANVANDDQPTIMVNTTGSEPSGASIKVGEIDTSGDTASEQWYRVANDGTLTFPTEAAADAAATNLREGTVVYDRANDNYWRVL